MYEPRLASDPCTVLVLLVPCTLVSVIFSVALP